MEQLLILKEDKGINSPIELFKNIKKINIDYNQENFILICLNTKNKIIHKEVLFKGGLNSCLIDFKTLFRSALLNNSNSIIVAHNHPSSSLTPSQEDIKVYDYLKKGCEILNLKILDSIIFNKKEFYSLNDK